VSKVPAIFIFKGEEPDQDEINELNEDNNWFDNRYDLNADDYEIIENGSDTYGCDGRYYDPQTLRYNVVRRKSDGKFFRYEDHWESWGYTTPGCYGDIYEVEPVQKTVYVKKA
jgi:hypothetical protein